MYYSIVNEKQENLNRTIDVRKKNLFYEEMIIRILTQKSCLQLISSPKEFILNKCQEDKIIIVGNFSISLASTLKAKKNNIQIEIVVTLLPQQLQNKKSCNFNNDTSSDDKIQESKTIFIIGNDDKQFNRNSSKFDLNHFYILPLIKSTTANFNKTKTETIVNLLENSTLVEKIYSANALIIFEPQSMFFHLPYQILYQHKHSISSSEIVIFITSIPVFDAEFNKLLINNINYALISGTKLVIVGTIAKNSDVINIPNQKKLLEVLIKELKQKMVNTN